MDRFEERPEQREAGVPAAGERAARTRRRWRTAAWLVLATATAGLGFGIAAGEGLLIAAGLVLAGVSGHLFTPEYRNPRGRPPG